MAPSRYLRHLGLPHLEEHGETDALLVMAIHSLDAKCACCNGLPSEVHDPDTQGRWQPEVHTCYLGEAQREYREKHGDGLNNLLLSWRLLPPGVEPEDPLEYSPARAAAEQAALRARLGVG